MYDDGPSVASLTPTEYSRIRPSRLDHLFWRVRRFVMATRLSAEIEGSFVVFLIGARINQPWNVPAWLPVFRAMPRMLRELAAQPELGLLGGQFHGTTLVQY